VCTEAHNIVFVVVVVVVVVQFDSTLLDDFS
jgi:hypothetical protein